MITTEVKVPEPRQLPTGRYYMQLSVDGQRFNKTFDDRNAAIAWAKELKLRVRQETKKSRGTKLTVKQAVTRYIDSKDAVLSSTTTWNYRKDLKRNFDMIAGIALDELTQEQVQQWVGDLALRLSPKSVANSHGLLSATLAAYRPDFVLRTRLPQRVKKEIEIPTENEIAALMAAAKGTRWELPIALAVYLGLRQSEVVGLRWGDVDMVNDVVYIRHAVVKDENGSNSEKRTTKTFAGTRQLHLPARIKTMLAAMDAGEADERIIKVSGGAVFEGYKRILKRAGIKEYRFHDLRHFQASVAIPLGVPDKYSMQRMGHASTNMLHAVYQHTMKEKELEYAKKIEEHIDALI